MRERKLLSRMAAGRTSPLSFATRSSPTYEDMSQSSKKKKKRRRSGSGVGSDDEDDEEGRSSRSPTPANAGKVEYITSFGGDSEEEKKPEPEKEKPKMSEADKNRLRRLRKAAQKSPSPPVFLGPELPAHLRVSKEDRDDSPPSYSSRSRCGSGRLFLHKELSYFFFQAEAIP